MLKSRSRIVLNSDFVVNSQVLANGKTLKARSDKNIVTLKNQISNLKVRIVNAARVKKSSELPTVLIIVQNVKVVIIKFTSWNVTK